MKIDADVDIDFADREQLLNLIKHVPAAMRKVSPMRKHSTGVHITEVPYDPVHDMAAIDYKEAEQRGYFKLDLLNVHVYSKVRNEAHLIELMREPDWSMLADRKTVEKLIHLNSQFDIMQRMPEPVNSIPRLAMLLAVIRPAKRHLIGKSWAEVSKSVWTKDDSGYSFKKSHAVAYSHLVVVHMNILKEEENATNV
jgi:hypothetical protein